MTVHLALGSNLGDRRQNIESAYKLIEERVGRVTSSSAFYYSKPVGFASEHDFVNSVCEVRTDLEAEDLLEVIQEIEREMGRVQKSDLGGYADRIIDIDWILAGDRVINTPRLVVPHPRMHERDFVLLPLDEIAPDVIHPLLQKSARELARELKEHNTTRKVM
ncbi:MAG: 2-amino-4-hydroxy-6-hydroxymethyldihydropteridine diphosphokinase [Bacteroidota bacterium]|nr:2-amino-4-hydroxy-6-hydroxymethyldihydropteridine diphosphokinase [Bacteroidota bacterium]HHU96182.1 2-amino-4-hydroxy-6-hydroxymethyldihydropteridine diphosphokinase [Petrimonas sp.]